MRNFLFINNSNYLIWLNAFFLLSLLFFKIVEPLTVVFAYFLETIIIGVFQCVKLWIVSKNGIENEKKYELPKGSIAIVLFFIFHYGMFVGVQSIFAFLFFQGEVEGITEAFYILHNYQVIITFQGMPIILASIFVTHLKDFYSLFLKDKQYREIDPSKLFFRPYVRIFIQQFVVILSGFFLVVFDAGFVAAMLLIIFRVFVDLVIIAIANQDNSMDWFLKKITKDNQDFEYTKRKMNEYL